MTRLGSIAITGAALLSSLWAAQPTQSRAQEYRRELYGKQAVARVGVGAAVGQVRHSPSKWGGGASGFGMRLGAGMATHAVKTSVEHGVAALRHEDLHYHPSNKKGFGPRLGYALESTVITHKTTTGKRTFAAGKTSGNVAAGAVSSAIVPAAAGGMATAGILTGVDAASNVAREFWPKNHHPKRQ